MSARTGAAISTVAGPSSAALRGASDPRPTTLHDQTTAKEKR
jgi:hypothetical protein